MHKPSKQIIIDAIIKQIEDGKPTEKICAAICREFQFSERTFYNHFKKASQQHIDRQDLIKREVFKVDKVAAIEARELGLKSKLDKQLELQDDIKLIDDKIKGNVEFTFMVGNKIMNSHNKGKFMLPVEKMAQLLQIKDVYLSQLNKMSGDYSPNKVENTIKGGGVSFFTVEE